MRFEYGRTTSYGSFSDRVERRRRATASVPVSIPLDGLRPNTRYHFRAVATNETGSTRSLDRSFRTTREPTGISITLDPEPRRVGRRPDRDRPPRGHRGRRHARRARAPGLPVLQRLQRGRDQDRRRARARSASTSPSLFETTQFRVVTRTRDPVSSGIRTASSALKVGRPRALARPPRARIEGAIWPRVPRRPRVAAEALAARALGDRQARRRRRRSTRTARATASRVQRAKRKQPAARYRVVVLARDGGAHVPGRSREVRVSSVRRG